MINALNRLGLLSGEPLPKSLQAFGIGDGKSKKAHKASLFATHPSLEDRVAALEKLRGGRI